MRVVGRAEDGIPEAIEVVAPKESTWCVGVQWHPELMPWGNPDEKLVRAFVNASAERRVD